MSRSDTIGGLNYSIRRREGLRLRRWAWRVYATPTAVPLEGAAWTSFGAKHAARQAVSVVRRRGARSFRNLKITTRFALAMSLIMGLAMVSTEPRQVSNVGMKAINVAVRGVDAAASVVAEGLGGAMPKKKHKKKKKH